jgi:hypothetical protein
MDLGLGPLADVVWAGLPAARPALAALAVAELDAAILADRSPLAVPGSAITAVLPPLIRDLLDRPQDGLDPVRGGVRMLARLVEVDAGLLGRHRGEVSKSLGWLTVEPYRSLVAGLDPALLERL